MSHPSRHLWPALQRRFTDQNKPSTAPDRLLRAFSVVPLEGQEESAAWTLGFKEVGSTLRTVSLSRDFNAVSAMVDPAVPCYLVVYVGDVQQLDAPKPVGMEVPKEWMLISYVPSSCTSFEAKKMADNRAGLKAGLGADRFTEGGMWCVHVEQISLSNYMRAAESAAGEDAGMPPAAAEESFLPPSRPEPPSVQPEPRKKDAVAELRSGVAPTDAALAAAVSTKPGQQPPGYGVGGDELADATEAIWEERIKGVRHAYTDSCSRLVGALEELEETLCSLSGEPYRQDEPILRARAHMEKNLQLLR